MDSCNFFADGACRRVGLERVGFRESVSAYCFLGGRLDGPLPDAAQGRRGTVSVCLRVRLVAWWLLAGRVRSGRVQGLRVRCLLVRLVAWRLMAGRVG